MATLISLPLLSPFNCDYDHTKRLAPRSRVPLETLTTVQLLEALAKKTANNFALKIGSDVHDLSVDVRFDLEWKEDGEAGSGTLGLRTGSQSHGSVIFPEDVGRDP